MEIKTVCPLGSECEVIKNNKLHRCHWYVKIIGKDPQSEKMIDQWNCVLAWLPILLIENAQTNRGQTAALESLRNEVVRGQNTFNSMFATALNARGKKSLPNSRFISQGNEKK